MMKRNKLFSKTGFYYYNMLAFITNGNKRFADKKLIFGTLLIGFNSHYGCKTKTQNNNTLQRDKDSMLIEEFSCYVNIKVDKPVISNNKSKSNISKEIEDSVSNIICFTIIEDSPEFPGGEEKLFKFLKDSITYPSKARENNIQGTVYVGFIIEVDGSISNVNILRGVNRELDAEALRVIKLLPKWIPGEQRGKPIRMQFNMPIKFTLDTVN